MMGSINRLLTYDNIFVSMTRTSPLKKLMRVQSAEIAYGRAWARGLDNTLALRHKIFYSTPENGFDLSGGATVRNTFSVSEAQLSTHWGPGELFLNGVNNRQTLGSKLPVFYLDYTFRYMSKFIGNQDIINHKLDFQIRHRFHWQLGLTKYNIAFSKTWGPTPYPVMTIHTGNQNWLYNKYAFNLMRDFEFASDASVALTFDHFFEGFFLNKIPLVKKLGFREIFSAKLLYGTMSAKNAALMPLPQGTTAPGFYAEIGFGVENIFKLFRVDFVWRMTQLDKPTTVPFGVKFAIQPKF